MREDDSESKRVSAESLEGFITDRLAPIIEQCESQLYTEEALAKHDYTDEQTLGDIISKYLRWNGKAITRAFIEALEDSNFHTLAANVQEIHAETEQLEHYHCDRCALTFYKPLTTAEKITCPECGEEV